MFARHYFLIVTLTFVVNLECRFSKGLKFKKQMYNI